MIRADAGDGQVTMEWEMDPNAVTYNIYYLEYPGHTPTTTEMQQNGTKIPGLKSAPYIVTGLTNGTTYYFTMSGTNSNGESYLQKPLVYATPIAPPRPAAPENVRANAGDTRVTVTWTPVTAVPAVTSYNVYCTWIEGLSAGVGQAINVSAASNSYVVHNVSWTAGPDAGNVAPLTNGRTHYFWVSAVNANGESSASFTVSAVPSASPPPFAPTITAVTAGDSQITVHWNKVDVDPAVTKYRIYIGKAKGVLKSTGVPSDITDLTEPLVATATTNINNDTTYYFVITAINANGESAESNEWWATPSASDPHSGFSYMSGVSYMSGFSSEISGGLIIVAH